MQQLSTAATLEVKVPSTDPVDWSATTTTATTDKMGHPVPTKQATGVVKERTETPIVEEQEQEEADLEFKLQLPPLSTAIYRETIVDNKIQQYAQFLADHYAPVTNTRVPFLANALQLFSEWLLRTATYLAPLTQPFGGRQFTQTTMHQLATPTVTVIEPPLAITLNYNLFSEAEVSVALTAIKQYLRRQKTTQHYIAIVQMDIYYTANAHMDLLARLDLDATARACLYAAPPETSLVDFGAAPLTMLDGSKLDLSKLDMCPIPLTVVTERDQQILVVGIRDAKK